MTNDLVVVDFENIPELSTEDVRKFIAQIEAAALQGGEQIDIPIKHHFSNAVYAREMKMPAGALVVGKIHKKENLNILSQGEVSVFSIDGVVRVKAPFTFVGSPGAKRVIYAHSECVWTVIHGTSETDVDKIESEFIARDYEDLYLSSKRALSDVLDLLGATPEELTAISENTEDQIDFPHVPEVYVSLSEIHGSGLFAKRAFTAGEVICCARFGGKRTPAGRYSNHSSKPNSHMKQFENGDVYLCATEDIPMNAELTTDYYFNYINTRRNLCLGSQ